MIYNHITIKDRTIVLKGFFGSEILEIIKIKFLSMDHFLLRSLFYMGMFGVKIDAENGTYYIINFLNINWKPAIDKDEIKQLLTINPSIKIDKDLRLYIEKGVADLYVNKKQITRGIAVIILIAIFILLVNLIRQ